MSGSNGGGVGIGSILISGWTTLLTTLQNIQQSIVGLVTAVNSLAIGAAGNNNFTGTNTFKPPPIISAGAVGTGTLQPAGAISVQLNTSGIGNGAGTTNDVLFAYGLPANSLDVVGRGVKVRAWGYYAANGNNKTVRLTLGGTQILSTGVVTFNAAGWRAEAEFYKSASNVQNGIAVILTNSVVIGPINLVTTATDTATILLAVTGASPTTGAANDVLALGMVVEFLN